MRIQHFLAVTAFVAGLGILVVPAHSQTLDQATGQMENGGSMGRGIMSGSGMMSGGSMMSGMMGRMMGGGCARMMQSMSGGGQPNSQWQAQPRRNATPN